MSNPRTEFYQNFSGDGNLENYNGLVSHALPGLHGRVLELVRKHGEGQQSSASPVAIDLGAGQGAMSARLADHGYKVVACDYVDTNFAAHDKVTRFVQIDLNKDFKANFNEIKADLICAVEIVEHIENPRHFLRQCSELLADSGVIALTTPNIDSPRSKVDFVVEGHFHMFRESSYKSSGHITPISGWQLQKIAEEAGLQFLEHQTFGNQDYLFSDRPKAFIAQELVRRIGCRSVWGDGAIHIAILKRVRMV